MTGAAIGPLLATGLLASMVAVMLVQIVPGQWLPSRQESGAPLLSAVQAAQSLRDAADALATSASPSGSGFEIQVVSRSTLYAKPGGPLIDVPHPTERNVTLGPAEEYYLGGTLAEGIVAPDGFWLQMRQGPTTPEEPPDFKASPVTLAALVRGDKQWRNDGEGWYEADVLPGIGLDPRTLDLLPGLLRQATGVASVGGSVVDGKALMLISGRGKVADAPGLMAVDAEPFTEFAEPLTFGLDEQGRLAQLTARMRNTTVADFELIVETTVTFVYDGARPALPEALPAAPPPGTPAPDPADQD